MLARHSAAFSAALIISAASFAYPQDAPPVFEFDPVVTTSSPGESPPDDGSVHVTVIDVASDPARSRTVAEALESSVGLKVKSYGGLGAYSVAMIRGSSPNQIAVYLDGVPLNTAKSGAVNLSDLPVSTLERIEVYRGFTPPGFAQSGVGGVINLVTRKREDESIRAEAQAGSFNTRSANATLSHAAPFAGIMIHADTGHSDGDYSYLNDNGTPLNTSDDTWDLRENNQSDYADVMARVEKRGETWGASLLGNYYTKKQGLAGLGNHQAKDAGYELSRNALNLAVSGRPGASGLKLEAGAYHLYTDEVFTDRKGEIGAGAQEIKGVSRKTGADFKLSLAGALPAQYMVLSASLSRETYGADDRLRGVSDPGRTRDCASFILLGETQSGAWIFTPSIRYERYDNSFGGPSFFGEELKDGAYDQWSPKLGASFAAAPWLLISANIARYLRAPDMTELFGDRGVVVGSPGLEPEEGVNFDMGLRASLPERFEGFVEAVFYYTESKNLIAYAQNSQRTSIARNIGRARIMGLEVSGAITPAPGWRVSFNHTLQEARDVSDVPYYSGNLLPNRPVNDFFARAERQMGRAAAFYEAGWQDETYYDRANFLKAPSRSIHNAGVSLRLPERGVKLTIEVKNMTGGRVEDAIGYPLPGRSFFVTVEYRSKD